MAKKISQLDPTTQANLTDLFETSQGSGPYVSRKLTLQQIFAQINKSAVMIYVDATAPAGGNGSFTNPFQTIADAMASITDTSIVHNIVLATDTYNEASLTIKANVVFTANYSNLTVTNLVTLDATSWNATGGILFFGNFGQINFEDGADFDLTSCPQGFIYINDFIASDSFNWIITGNSAAATVVLINKMLKVSTGINFTLENCHLTFSNNSINNFSYTNSSTTLDYQVNLFLGNIISGSSIIRTTNTRNITALINSNKFSSSLDLQNTSSGELNVDWMNNDENSIILDGTNVFLNADKLAKSPAILNGATLEDNLLYKNNLVKVKTITSGELLHPSDYNSVIRCDFATPATVELPPLGMSLGTRFRIEKVGDGDVTITCPTGFIVGLPNVITEQYTYVDVLNISPEENAWEIQRSDAKLPDATPNNTPDTLILRDSAANFTGGYYSRINTETTTSRTLGLADVNAIINFTNDTGNKTVIIPENATTAIPIGTICYINNRASDAYTLELTTAMGVQIVNCTNYFIGFGGYFVIQKIDTNTWSVLFAFEDYFTSLTTSGAIVGGSVNVRFHRINNSLIFIWNDFYDTATASDYLTMTIPLRFVSYTAMQYVTVGLDNNINTFLTMFAAGTAISFAVGGTQSNFTNGQPMGIAGGAVSWTFG
jgi:hypothetical protein